MILALELYPSYNESVTAKGMLSPEINILLLLLPLGIALPNFQAGYFVKEEGNSSMEGLELLTFKTEVQGSTI